MRDWLGPRFGIEVAIILAVAAALLLVEASWPAVFAAIFSTWLLIAVFELAMSRRREGPRAAAAGAPPESVRVVAPPAEPEPEQPAPAAEPEPADEAEEEIGPAPAPDDAPAPAPPVLTAVPAAAAPEAPAGAEPEPEPERVVELRPQAPREWNLWELERLARRKAGTDAVRDEEWAYLFMYLREFAAADGSLPADFDALVRESFGELVAVGR